MRAMMAGVIGGVGLGGLVLAGGCASGDEMRLSATDAEVGCSTCRFGVESGGCDLAVRIQGETYLVDGVSIDDFGDAHAPEGLCMTTRRADVIGRVVEGRFVAESIVLKP